MKFLLLALLASAPTTSAAKDLAAVLEGGAATMGVAVPSLENTPAPKSKPRAAAVRRFPLVQTPSCTSAVGMPVEFIPVRKTQLDAMGIILAVAHPSLLVAQVAFDRDTFARHPQEFQLQVLLHECAHKNLGHIRDAEEYEDEADCQAAKRLQTEFGYGRKEFDMVAESTRQVLTAERVEEVAITAKLKALTACFQP